MNVICYVYMIESDIAIAQNEYETHSTCIVAHTCATVISQSHHINSHIDIHTTYFSDRSCIHTKTHLVKEPLVTMLTVNLSSCFSLTLCCYVV